MLTTFLAWFCRKLVEFPWEVIDSLETWTSSAKRIGCEEVQNIFWHRSFSEPRQGAHGGSIADDTRAKTEGHREEMRHAFGCYCSPQRSG
jgi:hypothetical protein